MMRLNPRTNKRFRYGEVREDGFIFDAYKTSIIKKDGFFAENWRSPIVFKKSADYSTRRKKAITTDTAVSQNLADTFDGGTTTALIQGGMTKNKYLFQADLASKPTFGDAELKS